MSVSSSNVAGISQKETLDIHVELPTPDSTGPRSPTDEVPSPTDNNLTATPNLSSLSLPSTISLDDRSDDAKSVQGEQALSDEELRRLFEDEEIDRFLTLFADYVSEVVLPLNSETDGTTSGAQPETSTLDSKKEADQDAEVIAKDFTKCECEASNISCLHSLKNNDNEPPLKEVTLSEHIGNKYLLPLLPPARPRPNRFALGRLRIGIQRAYLVAQPAYGPFFSRLIKLAVWKDKRESALYCTIFWVALYQNLLMPLLFLRVLYALMSRRLLPHPTLKELRDRRKEAAEAEEVGEVIQVRLRSSSNLNWMEAWRIFRVFSKPKVKPKRKTGKQGKKATASLASASSPDLDTNAGEAGDEITVGGPPESQEEKDFKIALVNVISDMTDFHERVKNLFLWRRPTVSRICAIILAFLIVFTTVLPTKYLVKLAVSILGFLFWHVVPILASLRPEDRERLPPLLHEVPTDAEYAMQLISERVARGEDIRPRPAPRKAKKKGKKSKENLNTSASPTDGVSSGDERQAVGKLPRDRPGEIDWRKWGTRVSTVKDWTMGSRAPVGTGSETESDEKTVSSASVPSVQSTSDKAGNTTTYLAHHKASPGIVTLTDTILYFTPITGLRPRVVIALKDIRGVKKAGAMPGLNIRWQRRLSPDPSKTLSNQASASRVSLTEPAGHEVAEEHFRWVGGRDELFARLVAWGGRKWLSV